MDIGFALISKSPFIDNIIRIENEINDKAGFKSLLGNEHNLPHTTIFQGSISDNLDYQKIANELAKKYIELSPSKNISFSNVVYVPEGWYFYECQNTLALKELHHYCLSLVKDFIILKPDRLERNLDSLTPDQITGINEYGYRYAGSAFYPHITIGRTVSPIQNNILKELNMGLHSLPTTTKISRITVYEMGTDGTHKNTLYEVILP